MTVQTETNVAVFTGNDVADTFSYSFLVLDADHLSVSRRVISTGLVDKVYTASEYTVDGVGTSSGSITLMAGVLSSDYQLLVIRVVPYTQDLDIVNQGGFYPETVEEQLDKTVMGLQQVGERVSRSIVVGVGETVDSLPTTSERAGKFIAFNASGNPIATSGTGSDATLREDIASTAAGKGAAMVGTADGGTLADHIAFTTLESHGGGPSVIDNHAALVAALDYLTAAGGGVLQLLTGNYKFASASLGNGLEVPANVIIQGVSPAGSTLTVTGTSQCYFFLNTLCSSNQLFRDFTVVGNSIALGNGPGGFYFCPVLAAADAATAGVPEATASVRNCVLRNVRLVNFGGDAWVWFQCSHATYTIDECGLDWGCTALSQSGNSRAPTSLGVPTYIIEFYGKVDGQINDCFVNGLSAELSYVKGAVVAYSNVNRLKIRSPNLRNAFQGYGNADKGGYAILLYDLDGIVTETTIESPTIQNPFSCGIYVAGGRDLQISSPTIHGQEDTADSTLPKGAIALNGCNGVRITDPILRDNAYDIAIVGTSPDVAGYTYDSDMDIVVVGGSGRNASQAGVVVTSSAWHETCGGIRFIGYRSITSQAGASGMIWRINTDYNSTGNPSGIVDFEWSGGECSGGSGGFDLNFNRASSAANPSGNVRLSNLLTNGDTVVVSLKAVGMVGPLRIDNLFFDGTGTYHLDIENNTDLHINGVAFTGAVTGGVHCILDGSEGTLRAMRCTTGTQLVNGTGLGRALPTWTGNLGDYVQNTIPGLTGTTPNAYQLKGWGWLTGTTWYEDRTGLQ